MIASAHVVGRGDAVRERRDTLLHLLPFCCKRLHALNKAICLVKHPVHLPLGDVEAARRVRSSVLIDSPGAEAR